MRAKRILDLVIAVPIALFTFPLVSLLIVLATLDTKANGLFRQHRIGKNGEIFSVYKIRTMKKSTMASTITTSHDVRVTRLGAWMRAKKLDELPQLWNVVKGDMSLVGPRPDVPGYADQLTGEDRDILSLRPGITGPATLLFRGEEELLATFDDPIAANDQLLWPAKVRVNRAYLRAATLTDNLRLVRLTAAEDKEALDEMLHRWDESLDSHTILDPILAAANSGTNARQLPFAS